MSHWFVTLYAHIVSFSFEVFFNVRNICLVAAYDLEEGNYADLEDEDLSQVKYPNNLL